MFARSKKSIRVNQHLLQNHQKSDHDFFIEHSSIYEQLSAQAKKQPRKHFAIFPEYHKTFSYGELNRKSIERASYLAQQNILKGDRIGLILPTSPDFVVLYFAALSRGIVVVPINPDLSPPEIAYIISDARVKAVFYDGQLSKKISDTKKVAVLERVIFTNVSDMRIITITKDTNTPTVQYIDDAVIIYTSGTTGNPKGAVLSHLNLLVDSQVIAEWFQFTSTTRTLCVLPLFHNNGQVVTLLAPLYAGGSTVMVHPKTSLKFFWSIIKAYNICWTSVMPSILVILLSTTSKRKDSSMVGILCGGQVLTEEVRTQFENTFHIPIFEGYGLTETTSFASFNPFPRDKRKHGTVGRALPCNTIVILDENDREVAHGTEGEICIRGLNVMTEYLGLIEVNKRSLRNGWFHSGDYGYIDATGYLHFRTRKDYLIIKGGEKIYPSEIENVLFGHPDVEECAVIGVMDTMLGQDIIAFVKVHRPSTESILKEFFVDKLAHYKHPKRIIIVNELSNLTDIPKGPTKKILYRVLLEYYNRHLSDCYDT